MSAIYPQELPSQDFFENLLAKRSPDVMEDQRLTPLVIVYFTARWCGGCKRVDVPSLVGMRADAKWYSCDVDDNSYTPGYCGVRQIPAFLAIVRGKTLPVLASSDTDVVAAWLRALPTA
jgi:thioredoxin-like negative regulator of GroEL